MPEAINCILFSCLRNTFFQPQIAHKFIDKFLKCNEICQNKVMVYKNYYWFNQLQQFSRFELSINYIISNKHIFLQIWKLQFRNKFYTITEIGCVYILVAKSRTSFLKIDW